MTFLRTTVLCLSLAAPLVCGNALADDVLVLVESVQGEVAIHLAYSETSNVPVRPVAGDVFLGPLTIETGNDSIIDILVDGNAISISPGSSVVVEHLPGAQFNLNEQLPSVNLGPTPRPWQTHTATT